MPLALPVLSLLSATSLLAQAPTSQPPTLPTTLQNGNFEEGDSGQLPKGWFVPKLSKDAGYRCVIAEDTALPGKRCALLTREGANSSSFGNLMQNLDASPYRGKRIRLKGQLRFEAQTPSGTRALMWLRVDRAGQKMGFFDNMQDRPVQGATWTHVEIVGDVATDAEQIALGSMCMGGDGNLRIAPMTLEILGDTPKVVNEGPKSLTVQGLKNLEAFTRALNYVRFFHPSDEAAKADWQRLAREGVRAVEAAASTPELAKRLHQFFAPYAPSVQFLAVGQKPKVPPVPPGMSYAVRWSHLGFGQNQPQSIYKSTREYVPHGEVTAKGWVDPHATQTLALSADLRVWLPSIVYANAEKNTLPKASADAGPKTRLEMPEPTAGAFGSGDDRATRLGNVALTWGIFQHFYPYFDVTKTVWNAELPKALRAAAKDKDAEAFTHTLRRMTAALKDGHVHVFDSDTGGQAIPLDLVMMDGAPVVSHASPKAPVLVPGTRILFVDGEASDLRVARLKKEISSATEGWMNTRLAQEFLAGDMGTGVKVRYRTPKGFRGEMTLVRNCNYGEPRESGKPGQVSELKPGIWYVDLDRISDKDFEEALPKLVQAKGVIFDLRGYPKMRPGFLQHLTDKPIQSARWNSPIVTQPDGKRWEWQTSGRWELAPKAPRIQGKVVFLAGGHTISYAESCMGIVEAYKLAEIVGEQTAGTNGNINPFSLPGGYSISWTGMKVLKHDGTTHHGVGIHPTVPVKPTVQGLAAGRDEVLEKGLEVASR